MLLTKLIDDLGAEIYGKSVGSVEATGIAADSRKVKQGYVFVALKGVKSDGAEFIQEALKNGAVAVISSEAPRQDVCFIRHKNPHLALAKIAARFYPAQPRFIAAVTGTNGKTSVVNFCRQIWTELEKKSASIGTIGIIDGNGKFYDSGSSMTTPNPIILHEKIDALTRGGTEYLAIEASSHGLDQYRLDGLKISTAAFTNLTRDHLDYHGNMLNYLAAKKRLFSELVQPGGTAVLNADAADFPAIKNSAMARGCKIISFGKNGDNIMLKKIETLESGQKIALNFNGENFSTRISLVGEFQAENILCALGIVHSSGFAPEKIMEVLPKIKSVPGRMEPVGNNIFVDYAHTPDALEKSLKTLRPYAKEKLIVVFGCGGDRDKGKRVEMGKIAGFCANVVIVTDDNPRSENPATIRKEILAGAKGATEISDRKKAIEYAVSLLKNGNILLIAGKGHEKTQIIGNEIYPFDDVEIARQALGKK